MRKFCLTLMLLCLSFSASYCKEASSQEDHKKPTIHLSRDSNRYLPLLKQQMLRDLDFIQNNFEAYYAPSDWKKKHFNWDLEREIENAKDLVLANPSIKVSDYHRILRKFFNSTRDYHVSIRTVTTETASLPFAVRGTKGRYFFVHIDKSKLSKEIFPFKVGDELISFNNRPVDEVIQEIKRIELGNDGSISGDANDATDQALAEIYLTSRKGSNAPIPKGPICIEGKEKMADHPKICQLTWDYFPEWVADSRHTQMALDPFKGANSFHPKGVERLFENPLLMGQWDKLKDIQKHLPFNAHNLGGRKGFLPRLGEIIWEAPAQSFFDAYLFLDDLGHLVGYVRIPHYVSSREEVKEFASLIRLFEKKAQGLVIDQLNNPGGSVFYLYALAAMFAEDPLSNPKHRMKIGQEEVLFAKYCVERFEYVNTNEEAIWAFGAADLDGYPVNYQFIQLLKAYSQFILDEWDAGKTVTDPYHLYGVDKIHVSSQARYTKPVLLLTNELDFSGGDFFPAIMQDNKRAKIMGARTAGAGGYVLQSSYPNNLGVSNFSITGSIAERINHLPIENLGITPDWPYELTANDLENSYEDYKKEILSAVGILLDEDL